MQVFDIITINYFISFNSCFLRVSHHELCQLRENNRKNQKTQKYITLYSHEETTISVTGKIMLPKSSFEPIQPPFIWRSLQYISSIFQGFKIQRQLKCFKIRPMNTKNGVTFSLFYSTVILTTIYLQLR